MTDPVYTVILSSYIEAIRTVSTHIPAMLGKDERMHQNIVWKVNKAKCVMWFVGEEHYAALGAFCVCLSQHIFYAASHIKRKVRLHTM